MKKAIAPTFFSLLAVVTQLDGAQLITRFSDSQLSAGGYSLAPTFSQDGNWVFFLSHAANLVTNDDRADWMDLFARNLSTTQTVLVSINAAGTGGGNWHSASPSISSNGQFVA